MKINIIIAGLGGQGVVYLTRLLAKAAIINELFVMVSESHGMSQRGGSVVSHLKIGGGKAPLIHRGTADLLISLDEDEAIRNLPFLRKGGTILVNSENGLREEVSDIINRLHIQSFNLPANRLALDLGSPAIANVVMLGFASSKTILEFSDDSILEAVKSIGTKGIDLNIKALKAGQLAGNNNNHNQSHSQSKNSN